MTEKTPAKSNLTRLKLVMFFTVLTSMLGMLTEWKLFFFLATGILLLLTLAISYREFRLTNPPNLRIYRVSMGFLFLGTFAFTLAWLGEQPLLFVVAGASLIAAFVTYRQFRLADSNKSDV
jgi:hypothetical protein